MSMIICEECTKEFSDKAEKCPSCGCPLSEMTIFIEKKEKITCPIRIHGDEKLGLQYIEKPGKILVLMYFVWILFTIVKDGPTFVSLFFGFISVLIVFVIVGLLCNLLPAAFEKRKNTKIIFNYFKIKYPLLKELKLNYKTLEVVTRKGTDIDYILFGVYMLAHQSSADAIVINNDSVISHISGGKRIRTETEREVIATLIKYK